MTLNYAHEGYEYQDLITSYFILKDILSGKNSTFTIDRKNIEGSDTLDKFDDLVIVTDNYIERKQFKYSNEQNAKKFTKDDLSSDSSSNLALDTLFNSWKELKDYNRISDFRLCLAWDEPVDEILNILINVNTIQTSFKDNRTKIYQVDCDKLWPCGEQPLANWKRFRSKSASIDRDEFLTFCQELIIEINFPKASLDLTVPGTLEKLVLEYVVNMGIGIYPNEDKNERDVALNLLNIVKKARTQSATISTQDIITKLELHTDYGSVFQEFEIDERLNVDQDSQITEFINCIKDINKIIITGVPGSGKSWFIQNFINYLYEREIKVAKHYCFVSTEDDLQIERIKTNTFYGNLIADIIEYYPDLRNSKLTPYGANLDELNNILTNISEEFYIFIDGLDHINRVYSKYTGILAGEETEIIDKISYINLPKNVKIILGTQPIKNIDGLLQSGFREVKIPEWDINKVDSLLNKYDVENKVFKSGHNFSTLLLEKSKGNPLYLSYLIKTIKGGSLNDEKLIDEIPQYDYNLSAYYTYLLSKLSSEKIALIFAGIEFSVTNEEIKEISGLGQLVTESINVLLPLLKQNYSTGGFTIYHESFRRFILEKLIESGVKVEKVVYRDVIEWLGDKGYYKSPKAYKHLMALLFESKRYEDIKEYINIRFFANSLINGYDKESIKTNYKIFVKTAEATMDWPLFILLSEISRNIYSFDTSEFYSSDFKLYFQAIFNVKGIDVARNILMYEGDTNLSTEYGLKGCYAIDADDLVLPWSEYLNKLPGEISLELYKYYLRGNYRVRGKEFLLEHISTINKKDYRSFINVFVEEYTDLFGIEEITDIYLSLTDNLNIWAVAINKYIDKHILPLKYHITIASKNNEFECISEDILFVEHVYEDTLPTIHMFIQQLKYFAQSNHEILREFIKKTRNRNWFYNWVAFTSEYFIIKSNWLSGIIDQIELEEQLVECYKLLTIDLDPFKGKPKTCDLYYAESLIYDILREPLLLIKSRECWIKVFDYLKVVTTNTTTSLQGSKGGPLTTEKLFSLLLEFTNSSNIDYFTTLAEQICNEEQEYGLYCYHARYELHKSILYAKGKLFDKANESLLMAVQYLTAYGERKDVTLLELLDSIDSLCIVSKETADCRIKDLKLLCDVASYHTDGSETKWFTIHWFEHYAKNYLTDASLYLANRLKKETIDWRLEDSLVNALYYMNNAVNPEIVTFLYRTLPTETSEKFVEGYLINIEKLSNIGKLALAGKAFSNLTNRFFNNTNIEYKDSIKQTIASYGDIYKLERISFPEARNYSKYRYRDIKKWWEKAVYRTNLGNMQISEAILQFKEGLDTKDQLRLKYFIEQFNELTDELKFFIKNITNSYGIYNEQHFQNIEEVFDDINSHTDIKVYSYICLFTYWRDGWGHGFININAFRKALSLDKEKALIYLSDLLKSIIYEPYYNSNVTANLINAFTVSDVDKTTITSMWNKAFDMIEFRLPGKSEFDWNEYIQNTMSFEIDEIGICLLFARLKHPEVRRQKWALTGISYLLYNHPNKLIKPIKWFLENSEDFMDVAVISVLQILLEYFETDGNYVENFKQELENLLPSCDFLKDFIISVLLDTEQIKYNDIEDDGNTQSIDSSRVKYFSEMNNRNRFLTSCGFDLKPSIAKYYEVINKKEYREQIGRMFYNQLHGTMVENICFENEWIRIINRAVIKFISNSKTNTIDLDMIFANTSFDIKTLIAYQHSLSLRPKIPLPQNLDTSDESIMVMDEWIILAHYEKQSQFKKSSLGNTDASCQSFGGVVFGNKCIFPFSKYQLNTRSIWEFTWMSMLGIKNFKEPMVLSSIEHLGLEKMYLLWIYPQILGALELEISSFNEGIQAKNKQGEVVLKFICWECDFLGYESITDEVARLEGAQLMIRDDYFQRLCIMFNTKPKYIRLIK